MSTSSSVAIDGRSASRARRHALSTGKSALPPSSDRVRRAASAPAAHEHVAVAMVAAPAPVSVAHTVSNGVVASPEHGGSVVARAAGGRDISIARRRALSAGKAALRTSTAVVPAEPAHVHGAPAAPLVQSAASGGAFSCRDQARARRADHSLRGRGDAAPALPTRPPRIGVLEYAPKVVESQTQGGGRVTGVSIDRTRHVTGVERGSAQPISGTQYIGADSGGAWRAAGPKVGHARTEGGAIVSGTLIRSKIHVTGDEAGSAVTVTGEADARIDDDVTQRSSEGGSPAAQFARQTDPHGHSVHSNLARSARFFGSRDRDRANQHAIESTEGGLPVTGSAVGSSVRVTGDEAGTCRAVTGDQYLAPARRRIECGGSVPAAQIGAGRPDPVTGAKVGLAHTWSGRRVTGLDVEQHLRVTGGAAGACATITGSSYQGPRTMYSWCDDASVDEAERRLFVRAPASAVTGDTPLHDTLVTGTARGAARDITGTPYYREAPAQAAAPAEPVAAIDGQFTVRSPQRTAHLQAGTDTPGSGGADRITGSFAVGNGKLTGNLEFVFRPRQRNNGDPAAHMQLTGEGRAIGRRITGIAWGEQSNVTGTEGPFAGARNPSERGGKPHTFAGARRFKALASSEEPKHLVTGMFGYSSDSAAKVTLSGGAQG